MASEIEKPPGQITSMSSGRALVLIFGTAIALLATISYLIALYAPPSERPVARETGWFGIKGLRLGCLDRDRTQAIERIKGSDDRVAFERAATSALTSGACIVLNPGDEVYLTSAEIFGGMARVRPRGSTAEYWIYASGI